MVEACLDPTTDHLHPLTPTITNAPVRRFRTRGRGAGVIRLELGAIYPQDDAAQFTPYGALE